jgi:hypothetical protein
VSCDNRPELMTIELVASFAVFNYFSLANLIFITSEKKFFVPHIVRFSISPSLSCIGVMGATWLGPGIDDLDGLLIHLRVESTVKKQSGPIAMSSSTEFGTIYVASILV